MKSSLLLMTFLPYEYFTYESPFQIDEAIKRLAVKINPNPPLLNWKFGKLEQPFQGKLEGNKFVISKTSTTSLPQPYVFGNIIENEKGCTIHITLKPLNSIIGLFLFVHLLMAFFTVIVIFFTVESIWPAMLFPIGMILIPYAITTLLFKFQASFVKDELIAIFSPKLT